MRPVYLLLILLLLFTSCSDMTQETTQSTPTIDKKYPETKKVEVSDMYFGTEVIDPYRWLEDDRSEETEDWVKRQNKFTYDYLDKIPFRDQIEEKLSKLWNYAKRGAPFKEGGRTYYYKNDGLQDQYVIYTVLDDQSEKVFLDPNTFSDDGTVSLGALEFSKDGNMLAYSISEGGSDWRKIILMDVESHRILEDTLVDVKFSGISWNGNDGFFYSSYDKPEGSELSAKTDQHKLYYHKLGTNQKDDIIVFGDKEEEKRRYVGGEITEDGRYLIITAAQSTTGNELYIKDMSDWDNPIISATSNFDSDSYVLTNDESKLFIVTNLEAPNKKVISVDARSPQSSNWIDIIPENENVLTPTSGGGFLFAHYMMDAISQVKQYDFHGNLIQDIKLPGLGTASGFSSKKEDPDIYYSFSNYYTPSSIFKYDTESGHSTLYWSPKIDFDPSDYESEQVFYTSKDGTKVPMIITYKKGLERNGKNPTILYGYGGFNISLTPSYSITNAVWMELGGVYAVPNIRGGGEYGEKWHEAGTKMQKQNVFDDFISAAEYLIDNQYTSSDYLALSGGSNGGLLVAAVTNQRPDLMAVSLPRVGVLDMLRYHTFTAGAGWAYDYGTAEESEEMFTYLHKYSPVHTVRDSVKFPAVLVFTGDHDDRVVPAHSFKYAARLQEKETGPNPTLIRIETDAGHGAGTPVSKTIKAQADLIGFTLYNMGFTSLDEINIKQD